MAMQRTVGAGQAPVKTRRPVQAAPAAAPTYTNRPKPTVRPYVPKSPQGDFDRESIKWLTDEAKAAYDGIIPRTEQDYYAWIPMPMFDSQLANEDVYEFCSTRYPDNEALFGEWAYLTSLAHFVGTARKTTFCVLPGPGDDWKSDGFVSSPYVQLWQFLMDMHRERPFARTDAYGASWWHLINFDSGGSSPSPVQKPKNYYLMLSIMLREVKNTYNRDSKKRLFTTDDYFDPAYLGKGLGPDDSKLTVMAVPQQVWEDLASGFNARDAEGELVYPDPCDPGKLAVCYAWNHKKAPTVPVPHGSNARSISGMTGAVSGIYFRPPKQTVAGRKFVLPKQYINDDGTPTDAYFAKVPIHIGDTIKYLSVEEQVREMARAFADAKSLLELAFGGTQFEEYLEEPAVEGIFAQIQQKYIYDSSVHAGAPVSVQVTTPPASPPRTPRTPKATPSAAPTTQAAVTLPPLPDESMVWESEDGYALDEKDGTYTDPETGEELLYGDLLRKIEQQNWRA